MTNTHPLLLGRRLVLAGMGAGLGTATLRPARAAVLSSVSSFKPVRPAVGPLDASIENDKGETVTLSHWRGKPLVVHFWATWCGPCLTELPQLDAFVAAHAEVVTVVPVAVGSGTARQVQEFYAKHGVKTLPVYIGKAQPVADALKLDDLGLPMSIILDAQGRLIARADNGLTWQAPGMAEGLSQLLKGN